MVRKKKMIVAISLIVLLIILDQLSKYFIIRTMEIGESVPVFKNFFYITSHRNTGAAWGMFAGAKWFLIIVTIIALGIFTYLMKDFDCETNLVYSISLILMISGTFGNFIDRIFRGEVVDFLDFIIFKYNFPIFNLADTFLTIGVIMLSISILFGTGDMSGS